MSHEVAVKSCSDHPYFSLFHVLKPVIMNTAPEGDFLTPDCLMSRFQELEGVFEKDMHRMADVSELLFGADVAAYGERCTAVFSRWEEEGGAPTLTAMIAQAIHHFDLDPSLASVQSAFAGAVLAEVPNDLQYHGNDHYRKVLFHSIRLVAAHNQVAPPGEQLSLHEIGLLLASACIHDLGHPGGDNAKDGVYTPGLMEQHSFDQARPYFEALGMSRDEMGEIETIVFCTDITFFAGDHSPCVRMKKIYKSMFWDDQSEDVSIMMMGKLRRYEDNPKLALMAMLLHEADVGTSAGLSYDRTVIETVAFLGERGISAAGPKVVLAFLRDQLGETLFTDAGRALFGPGMVRVIAQAEQDVLAGRETFSS